MKHIKRRIELCTPCGGMWYSDGYCPSHNPAPADDAFEVPSRAQHRAEIRFLWKLCIAIAFIVFVLTGTTTGVLFALGLDPKVVVAITTAVFQVLIMSYGMGFFVPAFLTSLKKMGLGVEMSREGLMIGRETAEHINRLQGELQNLVNDAQSVVAPLRDLMGGKKGKPSEVMHKIVEYFEKLEKDGTIEEIAKGIKEVSGKIGDVIKKEKDKAISDEIDNI